MPDNDFDGLIQRKQKHKTILILTQGGLHMYFDERTCEVIDELMRKGTTRTVELSDILERDYGIRLEPHFISEYKFMEIMKGLPL
jgi:hypothetical protein